MRKRSSLAQSLLRENGCWPRYVWVSGMFRPNVKDLLDHAAKSLAVERARPMLLKGLAVDGSTIALVAGESVLRINGVKLDHQAVTIGFCEHRRSGDRI